jgi:hypothetical protein
VCCDPCIINALCRVTGGGNAKSVDHALNPEGALNRYTHGGQCGAPDAEHGEWTHSQKNGPAGKWTFHAGTSSAPEGTYMRIVNCCDSDGTDELTYCHPARPAPAKQINLEGVGVFKNTQNPTLPPGVVVHGADRTFHYVTVHVEDLGEPGGNGQNQPPPNPAICPPAGQNCNVADCDCPDFYRITIYQGVPEGQPVNMTDKLYEVYSYLDGGNQQIHPPIGDVNSDMVVNLADLNIVIANFGTAGMGDVDGNGVVDSVDLAFVLAHWGQSW